MTRQDIIDRIGKEYLTTNVEKGEYSYVKEAGTKANLSKAIGKPVSHFILDIRFECNNVVILVETKQQYEESDIDQLKDYLLEEKALHNDKNVICILANTDDDDILVWKNIIDDDHLIENETVINSMQHYVKLFKISKQNDREKVLKNTYDLNELLHKMDIDEKLRSQFVGTTLLYIKSMVKKAGITEIDKDAIDRLNSVWSLMDSPSICASIKSALNDLLGESKNKEKKIELLQKNVLNNQKVKKLTTEEWIKVLDTILNDIYKYIDADSTEGQDLLNLFFIAFNKYTGKADKNQAFTPDHITEFMCRLTEVDREKVVLDATCGSGSFLVQAMVKEIADCYRDTTDDEAKELIKIVRDRHIFGIEVEETAYGLATTNMLIHSDGNSNIEFTSCFNAKNFIQEANPSVILMNPPYNAKPKSIPAKYKKKWGKSKNGKEDPTKGLVFIHYISDVIEDLNKKRKKEDKERKVVKMAVLLPVAAAISSKKLIINEKKELLKHNTLEAVFTLPDDIFYPGATVTACCMLFTLGKPHPKDKETFFGYYKEDGFRKKKHLGRVEQFDDKNNSKWRVIEEEWLKLYQKNMVIDGKSSLAIVGAEDEWLCEAYMKTDYSKICVNDFESTLNDYLSYLVKSRKYPTLVSKVKTIPNLDTTKWSEFVLSKIFTLKGGFYNKKPEHSLEGTIPFLGSTENNNGVTELYHENDIRYWDKNGKEDDTLSKKIFDGNCIAVTVNGSVCNAYYQSEMFTCSHDITALYLKNYELTPSLAMFICTIIMQDKYRWSYGRKPHDVKKFGKSIIKLPIKRDSNGNPIIDEKCKFCDSGYIPDWDYMETFINSLPFGESI